MEQEPANTLVTHGNAISCSGRSRRSSLCPDWPGTGCWWKSNNIGTTSTQGPPVQKRQQSNLRDTAVKSTTSDIKAFQSCCDLTAHSIAEYLCAQTTLPPSLPLEDDQSVCPKLRPTAESVQTD
ncbi:hypothetical protein F2P81_015712 [Scophthalmus maximus]|uniref:Uncharacterized protein n=1 Tax=Scophthalmus maximus TaxID=52904 RepID=A0A6A4SD57_SCOMX|nr:hypothetical protein F2P81_015712 [Scophthalmus maximus]